MKTTILSAIFAVLVMGVTPALAQENAAGQGAAIEAIGEPKEWQMGFQPSATEVMDEVSWFHDDLLLPLSIAIAGFVGVLMLYTMFRFRASANPEPRRFSHNTLIEVLWTVIPSIIVFVMAIVSIRLVYMQDAPPEEAQLTIKAIGNSWFWEYEYPDEDIAFASLLVEDENLKEGQPRLLTVDNRVVIPVDTIVKVLITANPNDVIHSWTIPAFGIKSDAIPGRLNERWVRVKPGFEGRYYGQCSELCGERHAYMPITVDVVSREEYRDWVADMKEDYSADLGGTDSRAANKVANEAANTAANETAKRSGAAAMAAAGAE